VARSSLDSPPRVWRSVIDERLAHLGGWAARDDERSPAARARRVRSTAGADPVYNGVPGGLHAAREKPP